VGVRSASGREPWSRTSRSKMYSLRSTVVAFVQRSRQNCRIRSSVDSESVDPGPVPGTRRIMGSLIS
jgi:hypothetical protein